MANQLEIAIFSGCQARDDIEMREVLFIEHLHWPSQLMNITIASPHMGITVLISLMRTLRL
jgi:hypothetical protein